MTHHVCNLNYKQQIDFQSIWEYEQRAADVLAPASLGYYAHGAEDGHTIRENVAAFRKIKFLPKVLLLYY